MTARVAGMEEIAGTSASGHFCDVIVEFEGGYPSTYQDNTTTNGNGQYAAVPTPSGGIPSRSGLTYQTIVSYAWKFCVVSGAGSGTSGTSPIKYPGSSVTVPSTIYPVGTSTQLRFRLPASTVLGQPFRAILTGQFHIENWSIHHYTGNGTQPVWQVTHTFAYQESLYDSFRLRKIPLDVAAIDSRKTYAPPNKDGAYPAVDANADLRSVGFAGWAYRGGLFVGNAAGINGDQSGVARIQCQAVDPVIPSAVYTLSLLHIGAPSFFRTNGTQWDGNMTLQACVPTGTATANLPIGSVTWATAMPPSATAAASVDLNSVPAKEYVNLHMGTVFPYRVLLKATDEEQPRWRYFGGPTYDTSPSEYPYSECKPHLWACDAPSGSTADAGPFVYGPYRDDGIHDPSLPFPPPSSGPSPSGAW